MNDRFMRNDNPTRMRTLPTRRELLRIGLGGFTSLGLADLLRLRTGRQSSDRRVRP